MTDQETAPAEAKLLEVSVGAKLVANPPPDLLPDVRLIYRPMAARFTA